LGRESVGGHTPVIVEQVEAASSRNDRPTTAFAPGQTWFWRRPATWTP